MRIFEKSDELGSYRTYYNRYSCPLNLFHKKAILSVALKSEDFSFDAILKHIHCEILEKLLFSGTVLIRINRLDRLKAGFI